MENAQLNILQNAPFTVKWTVIYLQNDKYLTAILSSLDLEI